MKITSRTLILAILILIVLLLSCHLTNWWQGDSEGNSNDKFRNIGFRLNTGGNIPKDLPLKYNEIYYYNDPLKIPCDSGYNNIDGKNGNHAQIPCSLRKKCLSSIPSISFEDEGLFYKYIYEMAGREVLNRSIDDIMKK